MTDQPATTPAADESNREGNHRKTPLKLCVWCQKPATGTANSPEGRFASCGEHGPSRYHGGFAPWSQRSGRATS